jgi:TIR domain
MADAGRTGVFISHAHDDAELAGLLSQLLQFSLGLPTDRITCTSHEQTGLQSGEPVRAQIRKRLDSAAVLILLSTRHAKGKDWLDYEPAYAEAQNVPVHILIPSDRDKDTIPDPYRDRLFVTLTSGDQIVALLDQLARQLSAAVPAVRPLDLAAILSHVHGATLEEHERAAEQRRWIGMFTAAVLLATVAIVYLLTENKRWKDDSLAAQRALVDRQAESSRQITELTEEHRRQLKQFSLRGQVSMRPRLPPNARLEVYRNQNQPPIGSDELDDNGEYAFEKGDLDMDPFERVDFVVTVPGGRKSKKVSPADARLDIAFQ